jgi:uncharacterized protein (DUF1697 family)
MGTFVALLRAVNVGGKAPLAMADLRRGLESLGLRDVRTYLQSGNAVFTADEAAVRAVGVGAGDVSGEASARVTCAGVTGAFAEAIAVRLERDLGPRVGVRVLGAEELHRVVAANPFAGGPPACADAPTSEGAVGGTVAPAEAAGDEASLHATFLLPAATESDFGPVDEAAYAAVYRAAFDKLELPAVEGEAAAFVGPPDLDTPVVYLRLPHGYGRTKLNNAYFERVLGAAATTRNWRTVCALADLAAAGA